MSGVRFLAHAFALDALTVIGLTAIVNVARLRGG